MKTNEAHLFAMLVNYLGSGLMGAAAVATYFHGFAYLSLWCLIFAVRAELLLSGGSK